MLKTCFLLGLLVLFEYSSQKSLKNTNDFDYLILRQIWPSSSCMFPGSNKCVIDKNVNTWTIHGLWPTIAGTMEPSFCDKSFPFNFDNIKWLLPSLNEFWPNLYANTPIDSFWEHEWDKHGTCSLNLTLPQIKSESDYFNTTLFLRKKFDFGAILAMSSIIPDDEVNYDLDKIKFAIKRAVKFEPEVVCYMSNDIQYIVEMDICLSKNFQAVECATKSSFFKQSEQSCRQGVPVRYPKIR